jgi:hypothetical protein
LPRDSVQASPSPQSAKPLIREGLRTSQRPSNFLSPKSIQISGHEGPISGIPSSRNATPAGTSYSSTSASSTPPPKAPRQTFAVEIIQKRPDPQSASSSDNLQSGFPTLKRKHRFSKDPITYDERRPLQIQKRESSQDVSTTSTASEVVDPTDFSLVKDSRDIPSLFEPHRKHVSTNWVLDIPSSLTPLHPSKLPPYQRMLSQYETKLAKVPGTPMTFSNDEDELLPDGKFEFIDSYILFPGVNRAEEGFNTGCNCFGNGQLNGHCDLTDCSCASQDETEDGQILIPYERGLAGVTVLTDEILGKNVPIYECNSRCDCDGSCMNRVVQKGRTLRLEIFRTGPRGFGKTWSSSTHIRDSYV